MPRSLLNPEPKHALKSAFGDSCVERKQNQGHSRGAIPWQVDGVVWGERGHRGPFEILHWQLDLFSSVEREMPAQLAHALKAQKGHHDATCARAGFLTGTSEQHLDRLGMGIHKLV